MQINWIFHWGSFSYIFIPIDIQMSISQTNGIFFTALAAFSTKNISTHRDCKGLAPINKSMQSSADSDVCLTIILRCKDYLFSWRNTVR